MTRLAMALLMVAAMAFTCATVLAQAGDTVTHEGSIVKVEKDQMTIKSADAQNVITLTPTTKYTLDGKAAKLEDLKPGFKVKTTCKKEGTKFTAVSVDAKSA